MAKKQKIVPPTAQRTKQEVQADYAGVCSQLGDKVAQMGFMQSEVVLLQARARQLNDEFRAIPEAPPMEVASGKPDVPK